MCGNEEGTREGALGDFVILCDDSIARKLLGRGGRVQISCFVTTPSLRRRAQVSVSLLLPVVTTVDEEQRRPKWAVKRRDNRRRIRN